MGYVRYVLIAVCLALPAVVWGAPDAVTDLTAAAVGFRHVTLAWSAPYDAAASTTALYYEIRCSTYTPIISDAHWNTCSGTLVYPYRLVISSEAAAAGNMVSCAVTGLVNGRSYFFAVKASTDNSTWSGLDTTATEPFGTPFNTAPLN